MPSLIASTNTDKFDSLTDGIKRVYKGKIRPVEQAYHFDYFHSPLLGDTDIEAKPMVLLLGQYSVGKTSFVEHLLGRPYPGARIGPEPTTDKFVAVMYGEDDRVVPGNVATVQADLPFSGLSSFGASLMGKFQVSCCNATLLQNVTLIDSPGVLSGNQQRLGRTYDYVKVCEWFAERADMILLLFDAHKLDISDELKQVIEESLKGQDDKLRIVLNKADAVSSQQLMRVYGALMWSLGKVVQTPEVVRVYIGSFWGQSREAVATAVAAATVEHRDLLASEQRDLLEDLHSLPKNGTIRKVNEVIKRARLARVHAYILSRLRGQMPAVFGKAAKQDKLVKHLAAEFTAVQHAYGLPVGDFPEYQRFREKLAGFDFGLIPKLSSKAMQALETALASDLPGLLAAFPQQSRLGLHKTINPFTGEQVQLTGDQLQLDFAKIDHDAHRRIFLALCPSPDHVIPGPEAKVVFSESGLSEHDLGHIWRLADVDLDGALTFDEFSTALHLIKVCKSGQALPQVLPAKMKPCCC